MQYGNSAFVTTIKHENVKALDKEMFSPNIIEGSITLYWIIAIRNKSYKETFYISELLENIKELSELEQLIITKIYGLDGEENIGIHEIYEKYIKKENISYKKMHLMFIKAIKKLKGISM